MLFTKKTNTKLETLGITTTASVLADFSPNPQTQFEFPCNFNLIINDSYAAISEPTTNIPFSISYDAYGTLITPLRTYTNVFRTLKTEGWNETFTWYTINPTQVVLSVKIYYTEIYSVKFYENTSLNIVDPINISTIDIVPNPISNTFQIKKSDTNQNPLKYTIFDLTGRKVLQNEMFFNSDISIENLQNGNYIIEITDAFDKTTRRKIIKI